MSIIKGKDLMIFVNGKSIGYATSHTLEVSADVQDVTTSLATKDGTSTVWKDSIISGRSWSCSSENATSNDAEGLTYWDVFELYKNGTKVDIILSQPTEIADVVPEDGWEPNETMHHLKGKALITSISLNASVSDNSTFSVQFQGVGELLHVTA